LQLDKATDVFKKTPGYMRKYYTFDQYATRKAQQYLKTPNLMNKFEKLFITASAYRKSKEWDKAITTLAAALSVAESDEDRACYYYMNGKCLKGSHNITAAKEQFHACINLKGKITRELYAVPHCLTELAEILLDEGKTSEAKQLLNRAKNEFSNYDFDKPLHRIIKRLLDKVDNVKY